jgi:hypothetical protein
MPGPVSDSYDPVWTKAADEPEIGDRVRMRARKTEIVGILERWEDDSDEYIANVDGWATIRLEDRSTRVFRRSGGTGYGAWSAQAKTLRNAGDFRIEVLGEK